MFDNKTDFKKEFSNRLIQSYGTTVEDTHPTDRLLVLGQMIRDYASLNWKETKVAERKQEAKQVYYFSMEFLLGKMMTNNLKNLGIYDMVVEGLKDLGISYDELAGRERDAGLGNGGLGRLAACFMDSAASENLPINGNCIRYQSGFFHQAINEQGEQVERPDMWLRNGNPWEIRKIKHAVDVRFYGNVEVWSDDKGDLHFHRVNTEHVLAVPYDVPLIGANTEMVNTLRLWAAEPADVSPPWKNYQQYLSEVNEICEKLYPDDSTPAGKYLRLKQQYFFVAAGLQSIIMDHISKYGTLDNLADKVSIQLNDTHPVLAIPELMRILMDNHGYSWKEAWKITTGVMSYTNHTVMAEALETWPCEYLRNLVPRVFMVIEEMDKRFNAEVSEKYPDDPYLYGRVSIISNNMVHMARMAVIGSHSVNGVAKIHSGLLTTELFADYYRMWPERFNNKTNGITPRRFMIYSNPELKQLLDDTIGRSYQRDFSKIIKLMDHVDDPKVQNKFLEVKKARKQILADYILKDTGITVDVNSIFDSQAKRLHSYKRQLLNVLHIIYLYQRIKEDPTFTITPQTFIFAAKAASSYVFAKKVIKLINCMAKVINNDPDVKGMLKVVFLKNYSVSMAEILMPGSDVSEQISTAGKEASGTGNMKFMMNGAITLGTLDGATVEIDDLVGRENDVIFGLTVDQIPEVRRHYKAWDYFQNDPRIRKAMNTMIDGTWNGNKEDFRVIYDEILVKNDEYLVLADFDAYVKAHEEICRKYADQSAWAKSCLINIAKSGYFSSDRTINQYAEEIWIIKPLKI